MTYMDQFEAELRKRLQTESNESALVGWICERVLESYRNGIKAGENGARVKRSGQSRRHYGTTTKSASSAASITK